MGSRKWLRLMMDLGRIYFSVLYVKFPVTIVYILLNKIIEKNLQNSIFILIGSHQFRAQP